MMSVLTLRLLGRSMPKNASRWRGRLTLATSLLIAEHGVPSLGNFRDPIREIFYIVLSAQTGEDSYQAANRRLWRQFGTLAAIANAPLREIRRTVETAGLGMKRAVQLRQIARKLIEDFGSRPGRALRRLSPYEAFHYLTSLPGVGPKSALCVMMYSLDMDVFPVDAHVQRVLERMGARSPGPKHYHAQQYLPGLVPPGLSKDLHVTLIVHGRKVCRALRPDCPSCVIRHLCRTGCRSMPAVTVTR